MPTIVIGDKKVTVGDEFLALPKEEQLKTIDDIAAKIGATATPAPPKFQPEKGNLEGMPDMRRMPPVGGLALDRMIERSGGPAEFYGQTAKAIGRGIARLPGELVDLPINLYNMLPTTMFGVTPPVEPVGVKAINEALDLKETPAQYSLFEAAGSQAGGGAFGGAAKAGAATANTLKTYFNPKLANYLAAAEGKGPEILNWLRSAKELVPGSKPTVAQALAAAPEGGSAYTRFAGMQPRGVGNIPEEARTAYNVRGVQQREAREASIGTVAGTPLSKDMAEGQRLAKTSPMFEAAREGKAPVDVAPVLDKIDDLIAKNPGNPELLTEMQRIRKGLVLPETPATPELARTKAQEIASSLDGIKTALADEKNKFIKSELTDIKDMLVKAIPGMEKAQTTFAEMSKPINEMNIGTYLKDALTGPLDAGGERATSFAAKAKAAPQTVKLSTGQTARTLEEAGVSKTNVAKINAVVEDLNRSLAAEKLQAASGSAVTADPAMRKVNVLNRVATVFNEVVGTIVDYVGQRKAIQIAFEMLDPKVAADVLEEAMKMEAAQTARAAAAARVGPTLQAAGAAAVPFNALAPTFTPQNNLAYPTGQ